METTSKAMPSVGSGAAVVAAGAVAAGVAAGAWVDGRALVCARTIGAQVASHAAATINFPSLRFTRNARGPFVTWLNLFLDRGDCSPSPSQSFSTGTLRSETFASRNRQIQIAYLFLTALSLLVRRNLLLSSPRTSLRLSFPSAICLSFRSAAEESASVFA